MGRYRKDSSRYEPTGHEGIKRDRRSGIYYLRDTLHDSDLKAHVVDRSLKTDKISVALERAKMIRTKVIRGEAPEEERHTFDAAFDLVIKIQDGKSDKTAEQARGIIDPHLRPWFRANCPYLTGRTSRYRDGFEKQFEEIWSDFTKEAAVRKPPSYLTSDEERQAWALDNPEPRKLDHDRRYLVSCLRRAHKRGWIRREFTKSDFELNEVSEPIGKYVEDSDIKKILKESEKYPRLHLQILMALLMGMRLREILHLRKDEVDLKKCEINLDAKRLKTRRPREVPIPIAEDILPRLKKAIHDAPGPYIFPAQHFGVPGQPVDPNQPQNDNSFHWEKVRTAAGVDMRFHDCRHVCVTNLIKRGVPETAIRKICGVAEGTMRRIYAHIESEMKDQFRKAFTGKFVKRDGQ